MALKMRLMHKILLLVVLALVTSIGGVIWLSTSKASAYLEEAAQADLSHMTKLVKAMCETAAEASQQKVRSDLFATRIVFNSISRGQVVLDNGKMILDPDGTRYIINNDERFVDEIKSKTGSSCTVFLNEGSTAVRIATNVLDKNGSRALGTKISQEVFDRVVRQKETYFGRAWVVDRYMTTAYEPIYDLHGNVAGVLFVGAQERSESLRENILGIDVGNAGYIYTMDTKGVLVVHPESEGDDISSHAFAQEMLGNAPDLSNNEVAWVRYFWDRNGVPSEKIVAYAYFPEWDWIIGAGSYLDEFTAPSRALTNAIALMGAIFLLVALVVGFYVVRQLTRPVSALVTIADAVALGDVSQRATVRGHDEVADLGNSFNSMMEYLRENATNAEKIADNDLTINVNPRSQKDVLGHAFKRMTTNLTSIIHQLRDNARELVSAAGEIASQSEQMSRGASDQSMQVTQISSAVEEMSATILQASKSAAEATQASEAASHNATEGSNIVAETIRGMERINKVVEGSAETISELAQRADQIGEIISVIDDIADQTNLLALNAAIEAARAGEQGRGFAVVADEVRKLAERTGKATGEITEMIKGIQNQTSGAVDSMQSGIKEVNSGKVLADKAGDSLQKILAVSNQVMDMIRQIATASEQQSTAAEQVSKSMEQIASVTQETAKGAEQSATAAEELNRQAEGLSQMVSRFKVN